MISKNGQKIYMNNMASWPNGFYINEKESKTVKVTGTLIEKNDLPVLVSYKDAKLKHQGIPVAKEDLKKASHRYLLKDYKFED